MLARTLAQDTHIILLDEPTSSLDIGNAQKVLKICRELAKRDAVWSLTARFAAGGLRLFEGLPF